MLIILNVASDVPVQSKQSYRAHMSTHRTNKHTNVLLANPIHTNYIEQQPTHSDGTCFKTQLGFRWLFLLPRLLCGCCFLRNNGQQQVGGVFQMIIFEFILFCIVGNFDSV